MAQNIKITVTAEGAAAAAGDLAKVSGATEKLGRAVDKAAAQTGKVAAAAPAAAAGTRNMGSAALEASRLFEDMQYGIRGVLNNIPGLVLAIGGSAGIAGAASAAAVAVSMFAPQLRKLFGSGEDTTKSIESATQALDDLRKKSLELAAARGAANAEAWIESLDDEEQSVTALNNALDRNLALIRAIRNAEVEKISGEAAVRLAQIDADQSMPEAEKIRQRSAINQQVDRLKTKSKIAAINDTVVDAENKAAADRAAADRAASDAEANQKRLVEAKIERDDLEVRQRQAKTSRSSLEKLHKKRENLSGTIGLLTRQQSVGGNWSAQSAEDLRQAYADRKSVEQEIAHEERKVARFSHADAKRLAELGGTEDGSIAKLEGAVKELSAAAEKLRLAAGESEGKAVTARQIGDVSVQREVAAFESRTRIDDITTLSRSNEAVIAAQKKREAEQNERQAEEQRRRAETAKRTAEPATLGREAAELARPSVTVSAAREIDRRAGALKDGASGDEISALIAPLDRLAAALQKKDALRAAKIEAVVRKLQVLEKRLGNKD